MHELSLAQGLIEQLLTLADEHKRKRILKLTVSIGPFSGIVVDSFNFGFDALKQERALTSTAVLEIEIPEPSYSCLDCKQIFSLKPDEQDSNFGLPHGGFSTISCIACGSQRVISKGGDELILKQIEME